MQKNFFQGLLFSIFCLTIFSSCAKQEKIEHPQKEIVKITQIPADTLITLRSSSPLYGHDYTITISADGEVILGPNDYSAEANKVSKKDLKKSRITNEQLIEILQEFENYQFFSLKEAYIMGEPDCPEQMADGGDKKISIKLNNTEKSVHWSSCFTKNGHYPSEFFGVLDKIEKTVNVR